MAKENKFLDQYPQLVEKEYVITFYEVHSSNIVVKAGNPHIAREKAAEIYAQNAADVEVDFDYTMDSSTWKVEELTDE